MSSHPPPAVEVDHVVPVPRRIRAMIGADVVLDTTNARYVWENRNYPQYYLPVEDFAPGVLVGDDGTDESSRGTARRRHLQAGDGGRTGAALVYETSTVPELEGTVRVQWSAVDAWFEEDEEVFVHPRSPYTRVDALRSSRPVLVELDGVTLAESSAPVMVFETGLPTRYYLDRTDVDFSRLRASDTETACPYKGRTTGYWSAEIDGRVHEDIAWSYSFPTAPLLPVAGLIAFYNEHVDLSVDGVRLAR